MGKMFLLIAAIVLAGVAAEAPVGPKYLPPSQQFGAPFAADPSAPNTQYGAPFAGGPNAPSTQYGAPALADPLGGRYAAPGSFPGVLAAQYGAPALAGSLGGRYAGPLAGRYAAPGSFLGALASQYTTGRPSAQYGAPFPGSRFSAPGSIYAPGGGYARGGYNGDYDPLAEPANYEFSYDVIDPPSGNEFGHAERRQGEVAQGRYYVVLPDGRRQVVDYQADQDGYKPQVRYEDSGRGYAGREGYAYAAGKGGYTY